MHICPEARKHFLTPDVKRYLCENGPIGCRDKNTADFFNANSIPAYFSGCLTLTLQPIADLSRKDFIIAVDLPEHIVRKIKERTKRPVYDLSRSLLPAPPEQRIVMAKTMLYLYQSAHCVISSRLHVSMPCLALGTPALLIGTNDQTLHSDGRYEGLKELCRTVSENEFMDSKTAYDLDSPPENKDEYKKIRDELIRRCSTFTGGDNQQSVFAEMKDSDAAILNLISCLNYDYNNVRRLGWWIKGAELLKCLFQHVVLRKKRHYLP